LQIDKMPHQCLKCGKIYEDSKYVIDGCPNCGGKSFYYTKKPLDEKKRQEILKEIENKENREFINIDIKKEKIEDILEEIRKRKEEALREAEKLGKKVESISVKQVGEYEINVKRLIEEGTIIIYKEGAYYIYLPSLFKTPKR